MVGGKKECGQECQCNNHGPNPSFPSTVAERTEIGGIKHDLFKLFGEREVDKKVCFRGGENVLFLEKEYL